MLRKLRDFWKEWWPFLSSITGLLYTAVAYFADAENTIFLIARLFRWEIALVIVGLTYLTLVRFLSAPGSMLRPANAIRAAFEGIRGLAESATPGPQKLASATLLVCGLLFLGGFGYWSFETYAFLRVRFDDVDRQSLVAQAGALEVAQDLPRAISLYEKVRERFPYNRFNNDLEAKIESLKARNAGWEAAANSVRAFDARYPGGKASTRFDQLAQACRYVSNVEPCTRTEAYLREVRGTVEQAAARGASCRSVVSATPRSSAWIFLDPNDSRWLEIDPSDGAEVCSALGLTTGDELAGYLDERWQLGLFAELASWAP